MESRVVVLLAAVLRVVTNCTTEPTPSDAFTVLCSIVVLIVLKALSNIVITVKKFIVVELAIY